MTAKEILTVLWQLMNSPAGIITMASLLLWLLNRLYSSKPGWSEYEGAIISAVKFAEKQVPDDTENKGLARLDVALKYVLKVYEEAKGKQASSETVAELKEGIQLVHNKLEAAGTL